MTIHQRVNQLIQYGLKAQLIHIDDLAFTRNRIYAYLKIEPCEIAEDQSIDAILSHGDDAKSDSAKLLDSLQSVLRGMMEWAVEQGQLESLSPDYADLFDAGLMNCLMGRPSEVIATFNSRRSEDPNLATHYLYQMGMYSNYIRMNRIEKNIVWQSPTPYGALDITINLSKPEKDPKAIAALANQPKSQHEAYPKCLLCIENEGYEGRLDHPARQNLRLVPCELAGEKWMLQYSPYAYYHEHCIVLNSEHVPMKMTRATFERLVDFVEWLPHYFVGSNADLPIVGGSILTHDHYQGGQYEFAMARAESEKEYDHFGSQGVRVSRVKWPMSVIRISGASKEQVVETAHQVFVKWQSYSDASQNIISHTDGTPHNTVTPIARRRGSLYEMDIVLRNNRTTAEHPHGLFHPHAEIHHIKRENIGLIEVMGLAVLPGRLESELNLLAECLVSGRMSPDNRDALALHLDWYETLQKHTPQPSTKEEAMALLKRETGAKFLMALEHAGVFKRTEEGLEAFDRFMESLK